MNMMIDGTTALFLVLVFVLILGLIGIIGTRHDDQY